MRPYSGTVVNARPPPQVRESHYVRERVPENGTYRVAVPTSRDVRRDLFARFVKRAVQEAQVGRGWSVPKIAEVTKKGVSGNTIYRWLNGDWERDPLPAQIVAFCDALDIPPAVAFAILWPGKNESRPEPEPLPIDPDFMVLLRRLHDPTVSEAEKYLIRETIRGLAARSAERKISRTDQAT